jgi:hypothetical protein
VAVLVLVLALRGCGGGQKEAFGDYLDTVTEIVTASATLGQQTTQALISKDLPSEIQRRLIGIAEREQQLVRQALGVAPPQEFTQPHEALVQSLDFRAKGLAGLSEAFGQLGQVEDEDEAGRLLASQASRLIASDVVYDDLFLTPGRRVLQDADVTGVAVPESRFVENTELLSASSFKFLVQGLGGATEEDTGKLHGTELVRVTSQPADIQLSPGGQDNRLQASKDLAFDVEVRNSGDFQETGISVRLIVQQGGKEPIVRSRTIDVLSPGDSQTVRFGDLDEITLATTVVLKVAVLPVDNEEFLDNNAADYTVFLSFT